MQKFNEENNIFVFDGQSPPMPNYHTTNPREFELNTKTNGYGLKRVNTNGYGGSNVNSCVGGSNNTDDDDEHFYSSDDPIR